MQYNYTKLVIRLRFIVHFYKENLPGSTKSHTNSFEDHAFTKKNKVTYISVYNKNTEEEKKTPWQTPLAVFTNTYVTI